MSNEVKQEKGRLSWLIPVLDVVVMVLYLVLGFNGIVDAAKHFDFAGMFHSVRLAIIFLVVAIAIITILCFFPLFKSKSNMRLAIWNIIWIVLSIYEIL